jgi:very-short-patch-repair endonuclease
LVFFNAEKTIEEEKIVMDDYKNKEWLHHQHVTLNKSYTKIAKEFNIGRNTVQRWVKKLGIINPTPPQYRRDNSNPPVTINCENCGKERKVKHAKFINGYGRFCSESCASKFRYANGGGDKLMAGNAIFFQTEEGKQKRRECGVKGALVCSEGKRTSIEIKMADELASRGIEYEEQRNLGDKFLLDFFLPEYNIVIECDGDYWHRLPSSIRRDKAKNAYIKACDLSLFRFWESEINTDVGACVDVVLTKINEMEAI